MKKVDDVCILVLGEIFIIEMQYALHIMSLLIINNAMYDESSSTM